MSSAKFLTMTDSLSGRDRLIQLSEIERIEESSDGKAVIYLISLEDADGVLFVAKQSYASVYTRLGSSGLLI